MSFDPFFSHTHERIREAQREAQLAAHQQDGYQITVRCHPNPQPNRWRCHTCHHPIDGQAVEVATTRYDHLELLNLGQPNTRKICQPCANRMG